MLVLQALAVKRVTAHRQVGYSSTNCVFAKKDSQHMNWQRDGLLGYRVVVTPAFKRKAQIFQGSHLGL
jgi:hypothetical protein